MFLFTGRLLIRAAALRRLPFGENRFTTFAGQLERAGCPIRLSACLNTAVHDFWSCRLRCAGIVFRSDQDVESL